MYHYLNNKIIKIGFIFLLTIIFSSPVYAGESPKPVGTVVINEYELAYIFNGQLGGGKLYFQKGEHDFKMGGLGIGGIGVSHLTATGEVYNLTDVSQFPGTYGQASVGYSVTDQGKGHLWLQNQNGVVLHLTTTQQGLGLTAGVDGIVINMD